MATIKSLKAKAREYFYAENFVDLEDVMESLQLKSPLAAAKLRAEFDDVIQDNALLDEIGHWDA